MNALLRCHAVTAPAESAAIKVEPSTTAPTPLLTERVPLAGRRPSLLGSGRTPARAFGGGTSIVVTEQLPPGRRR